LRLARGGGPPLVIGHRGAKGGAPENSVEALLAAVDAGADLVEFDVARGLVVAHENGAPGPALDDVLSALAPREVGLHVDLKARGDEQAALEAIDRHQLRARVVISTAEARIARRVRALAPELPIAIGYPRDTYGVSRLHWPDAVTRPGAAALRAAMPVRIPLLLRVARANVLALHRTLCSRRAVAAAHARDAPVLVWTVDEAAEIRRFAAMGVDAIVTDDPKRAAQVLAATLDRP
jgi:glycerophosphoryl diester phosphodiesterase